MNKLIKTLNRHPTLVFFVLAYGISWIIWLPAAVAHLQGRTTVEDATPLLTLGGFGPFLAALLLTAAVNGKQGVGALLKGLLPRPIGLGWYLIALYGFLALGFLAILLFGIAAPQEILSQLPTALVNVPAYALTFFLLLGPLGEEPGWRGYALPRLQTNHSALSASAILGFAWAFWHLPLTLFAGWRDDVSIGAFLVAYPLYTIPLTIIFTWVYNHTGGSVFATMVLHSAFNYTVYWLTHMFDLARYDPFVVRWVITGLFWLIAFALISIFGPARLCRKLSPG